MVQSAPRPPRSAIAAALAGVYADDRQPQVDQCSRWRGPAELRSTPPARGGVDAGRDPMMQDHGDDAARSAGSPRLSSTSRRYRPAHRRRCRAAPLSRASEDVGRGIRRLRDFDVARSWSRISGCSSRSRSRYQRRRAAWTRAWLAAARRAAAPVMAAAQMRVRHVGQRYRRRDRAAGAR